MPLTSRSDATMCSNACRTWRRRHPGVPRPIGPQSYICEQCAQRFTRPKVHAGKRPRFCTDRCWEAYRHLQRPFGEWRVAEPYKPRPFTCQDCGGPGVDTGFGPVATRCPACLTAYEVARAMAWHRNNVVRSRAIKYKWANANRASILRYRDLNRDRIAAQIRRYQLANADRVRAWRRDRQSRRRAIKAAATVELFRSIDVYERDQWRCGICHLPVDADLRHPHPASASLDHMVPLSRGGAHALSNVQLAHLSCNIGKGASLP